VGEQTVTLYAPHGGQRTLLRRSDLKRLEVAAMPTRTPAWEISRDALGIFDASTFEERSRVPMLAGTREVLGKDSAGRVVISTGDGLVLVDRCTLNEVGRLALPTANGMRSHAFLDGRQTMVMIDDTRPRQLIVASW
jgi:hypothetical protein